MKSATMNPTLRHRARQTLDQLRQELLDQRTSDGHWIGRLSPSSLSTATAVSAISAVLVREGEAPAEPVQREPHPPGKVRSNADLSGEGTAEDRDRWKECVDRGIRYLSSQQNEDGGFGDTDRSLSNIATSYLVLAASTLANRATGQSLEPVQVERLERYLKSAGGIDGLRARYGKDKTFVIPILTNLAIAGVVPWDSVAPLPFEAAVFPQSMYRLLQMPVVSYAIPALVAIGQARHFNGPKTFWPLRQIRAAAIGPSMKVLQQMQPESGGYLEATPLTAFVVMSLAATGRSDLEVSRNGLRFLVNSMDDEGGWPIDTNLATWVTSLSVHALTCDPQDDGSWCNDSLVRWHLDCQHQVRHPFTGAEPGGWGWTDLSGAVPDGDDTPGAIIATRHFMRHLDGELHQRCHEAIELGMQWLCKLQNRDGGWPTFCRGWGKLPFDRSSNDLTAHVIRAVVGEQSMGEQSMGEQSMGEQPMGEQPMHVAQPPAMIRRGLKFLKRNQRSDGSWLPLWFGNQDLEDEINPVYGTSRVLLAGAMGTIDRKSIRQGSDFLIRSQNCDGGWGGGPSLVDWLKSTESGDTGDLGESCSSVEETALAVDALVAVLGYERNLVAICGVPTGDKEKKTIPNANDPFFDPTGGGNERHREAIIRGVEFLVNQVRLERHRVPWPIGFYFAKLWYHEELYPVIFATMAIGNYLQATIDPTTSDWLNDH